MSQRSLLNSLKLVTRFNMITKKNDSNMSQRSLLNSLKVVTREYCKTPDGLVDCGLQPFPKRKFKTPDEELLSIMETLHMDFQLVRRDIHMVQHNLQFLTRQVTAEKEMDSDYSGFTYMMKEVKEYIRVGSAIFVGLCLGAASSVAKEKNGSPKAKRHERYVNPTRNFLDDGDAES